MAEQQEQQEQQEKPQPQDLYKAEYLGSGTFIIKKPKRKNAKKHLTRVRNPQRRARRAG